MIGIEGQYVVRFSLGDTVDFVSPENLLEFTLIEEAGNVLPSFEFIFSLEDTTDLLYKLHEGNTLSVSMGADTQGMTTVELVPLSRTIEKQGDSRYLVRLTGLYNAMEYILDCKSRAFASKSGVEVMKTVAGSHFTVDSNVDSSNDSQTWIQPNVSDKKFMNNLWVHSDMNTSFIAVGITSDGNFVIRDIITLLDQDPHWRFVKQETGRDNEIIYDGDFVVDPDTGFLNQWVGYERTRVVSDLKTGSQTSISPSLNSMFIEGALEKLSTVGRRVAESTVINTDNTHAKYWESRLHNITHLAVFSSFKLFVSYQKRYVPMKILDIGYISDKESEAKQSAVLSHSGQFLITKISRSLTNNQFVTTCELNRESSILSS